MFCVPAELPHHHAPKEEEEDQEEVCSSQPGLKQENPDLMLTSKYEESGQSEDQTLDWCPDESSEEHAVNMSSMSSNDNHVADSKHEKGVLEEEDSESFANVEKEDNLQLTRSYRQC